MKNILFFVLFSILLAPLSSDVRDYLKKAGNKSEMQSIHGIDFIYMINLDQRPEKWNLSMQQLAPYGILPYRFSAVNGWELTLEDINNLGVKFSPGMEGGKWGTSFLPENNFTESHHIVDKEGQVYFCHCMSRGAIGIVLSHLSILQDAYDSGYETIWVMEDDIEILRDPRELSNLIHHLDRLTAKKWDVLFTDRDTRDRNGNPVPAAGHAWRPNFHPVDVSQYFQNLPLNKQFRKVGARFGAYSMIVRRSGMKKILDFITSHQIFLPYDLDFYLAPGIKMYAVTSDVVGSTIDSISDNGGPNYLKK